MIPTSFPIVAPAITVGELFGPLAPVAVAGVLAALAILVVLTLAEYRPRRDPDRSADSGQSPLRHAGQSTVRPAA